MKRLIAVATMVAATGAFAQQGKVERPAAQAKAQNITFDTDDLIEGGVEGPAGSIYFAPPTHTFVRMIKVRENFNDKLLKSVEEL